MLPLARAMRTILLCLLVIEIAFASCRGYGTIKWAHLYFRFSLRTPRFLPSLSLYRSTTTTAYPARTNHNTTNLTTTAGVRSPLKAEAKRSTLACRRLRGVPFPRRQPEKILQKANVPLSRSPRSVCEDGALRSFPDCIPGCAVLKERYRGMRCLQERRGRCCCLRQCHPTGVNLTLDDRESRR